MTAGNTSRLGSASLLDAVDHLLNRGAVLAGDATLSLAGVDLVYVGLKLVVSSVETLQRARPVQGASAGAPPPLRPAPSGAMIEARSDVAAPLPVEAGGAAATASEPVLPPSSSDPTTRPDEPGERPEAGLARLVLALVELLRRLLERQAVRRMEGATLSDEEVERMGLALMALEDKMTEIRTVFGLTAEDLDLDLGPLGRLLDDEP